MTALVQRSDGETIDNDDHNTLVNVATALGITNDNTGYPMLARSLFDPVGVMGPDANVEGKNVAASSSFTVPSGKVYVILALVIGASSTVTPSGGSAITLSAGTSGLSHACYLVLGAGDQITLGASSGAMGFLRTAPSDLTRILQAVDNTGGAMTYTVAAGKRAILTYAGSVGGTTDVLAIDGVGFTIGTPGGASTTSWTDYRQPLKAGQAVTGAAATDILISGVFGNA